MNNESTKAGPHQADPAGQSRELQHRAPVDPPVARQAGGDESIALLAMIERAAANPEIDLDRMERLYSMYERAQDKKARTAFQAGLSKLQAELPAAARRGKAHNQKAYARFEDVIEALRPVLDRHGFSITYRIKQAPNLVIVTGILAHALGHHEETELSLPHDTSGSKNPVQALASSISYGKRYVTLTLTGIATDDDDDGKAAGAGASITDEQAAKIEAALKEAEKDAQKFCAYFKIEKVADLPADKFDGAMTLIRKRA